MMKQFPKSNKNRALVAAALVGMGMLFGWLGYQYFDLDMSFQSCKVPNKDYRVAKFFDSNGELEMTVYAFSYADTISEELMRAAEKQGAPPAALYHQFYKRDLCPTGKCEGIALDIGAYLGTHGLYLAKIGFEVHSFEPYKTSTKLLRCSAKANKFKNLYVVSEGVSDEIGTECLLPPSGDSTDLAMFAPKGVGVCSKEAGTAYDVVTLDHYWTNVLGKRKISFIKIDTEGHELYVLRGGKQLFAEAPPPMMLMEFYPRLLKLKSVAPEDLINEVTKAGYRIYDCQKKAEIIKGATGLAQLARYEEKNEVTDLLLLHKSKFSGELKGYWCGY